MLTLLFDPSRSVACSIRELEEAGYTHPIESIAGVLCFAGKPLENCFKRFHAFVIDEQDLRVTFYQVVSACESICGYFIEP